MSSYQIFIEPWERHASVYWPILAMAFFVTAACGLVGNYLVLRRISLVGDAISHSVLPGIAIAFIGADGSGKSTIVNDITKTKPSSEMIDYILLKETPVVNIYNKIDLIKKGVLDKTSGVFKGGLITSALTGLGVDELKKHIIITLGLENSTSENFGITTPRQYNAIMKSDVAMASVIELAGHVPIQLELVSFEGNITLKDGSPFPHVHVVLSDHNMSTAGGHLFETTVAAVGEFFLMEFGHRKEWINGKNLTHGKPNQKMARTTLVARFSYQDHWA